METDKKIIYYTYEHIIALVVCIAFTIISCIVKYWWGTLFFGGISISYLIIYLHPKHHLVRHGSEEEKLLRQSRFGELYETDGEFLYTDWGFSIMANGEQLHIQWDKIIKIVAYKQDHFITDEIFMDILTTDNPTFTISENTLGWYQFLIHLKEEFQIINTDWFPKVAHPAFARNETILYEKHT